MPKVFVGELAPEELAEIGPDATPSAPDSWTRNEYRAYLLERGVQNCTAPNVLGIEGLLDLAEVYGLLEKRPNMMNVLGEESAR
ncbi:hypothetical protein FHU36_005310 [Nonomuraea muscovyensis]|uniref:Uncharacterized protein n=1 Tax=Nonomuraea muscovyensis TaxID=1124761 RepID=A0A7X0C792_9ACTN|nr:hypothetical protein [Nonomuraea muscovyensis]MBB6348765.1 hypothetical protein [Nonomuraea muscovyensis]